MKVAIVLLLGVALLAGHCFCDCKSCFSITNGFAHHYHLGLSTFILGTK